MNQDFTLEYLNYSKNIKIACEAIYSSIENDSKYFITRTSFLAYSKYKGNFINHNIIRCDTQFFLNETVLFLGIVRNNYKVVSKSIELISNLNILCMNGRNSICYAVEFADIKIIELLLQRGCNIVNPRGMKENPIKIAFEMNKFDIVDSLLGRLVEIPLYHFNLLEVTFKNDQERLLKLKKIPILNLS